MQRKSMFHKKTISLVLACCIIFSLFAQSFHVSAESGVNENSSAIHNSSTATIEPGNAETVPYDQNDQSITNSENSSSTTNNESSSSEENDEESDNEKEENILNPDSASTPGENDDIDTENSSTANESSNEESDTGLENDEENNVNETGDDEDKEEITIESLVVLAPENEHIIAQIGENIQFAVELNRDDVDVSYQWQRLQEYSSETFEMNPIYQYGDEEPTWYSFVLEDINETQYLIEHPDATWPGIETYYAITEALREIGEDTSNLSIAWHTPNFALQGYSISAVRESGEPKIYASKDGNLYTASLGADGKWTFTDEAAEAMETWVDIENATEAIYQLTVGKNDYSACFRCVITITDEEYKTLCRNIFEKQGIILAEDQLQAEQILYSSSYRVFPLDEQETQKSENVTIYSSINSQKAIAGNPALSDDAQWITGLNSSYEYITKDTYDRVTEWLHEGKITQVQADRYWTGLLASGFGGKRQANVLDSSGFPVGDDSTYRAYRGFNLTNNMLEVNSEWYGKTVYFRPDANGADAWESVGTAIDIPAYTDLEKDGDGDYIDSSSGTRYKSAITVLNPFVLDTGSKYKQYVEIGSLTTTASHEKGKGWVINDDGSISDNHITIYEISCETFNASPEEFLMDAEGNYRVDAVAWGVCTYEEPDISGKAYWRLKDYIQNGYGFLAGHDTMYAYAGAYYDALGADLNESSIDPSDGTTWYYNINSWMPGTTASSYERDQDGNIISVSGTSTVRGGHFYMNELLGSNAGNVFSGTVTPKGSPSQILSIGGSHNIYVGKEVLYGSDTLRIAVSSSSDNLATENPQYRTPTNYPYVFSENTTIAGAFTHTNHQMAFGPIWVDYADNKMSEVYGQRVDAVETTIDGKTGTNNFYLTGYGNFLMNQIGHLPANSATLNEARLLINSMYYVSQRKQCEICAANQNEQSTVHYVHRISANNADEILNVLRNGGNYWYSLNDCYVLTDNIVLPEDWQAIENFSGHWDADVYSVTLNSNGIPLFAETELGNDPEKGKVNVFDEDMNRTIGIARIVGDLNDLFNTNKNYAGYVVQIQGKDNPYYLDSDEVYSCVVNTDSKYVISNVPCVYNSETGTGVLKVRIYDTAGQEVLDYGHVYVNVDRSYWDTTMTTTLYLGIFNASPISNRQTYESSQTIFHAITSCDSDAEIVRWEYRASPADNWKEISELTSEDNVVITNAINSKEGEIFKDYLSTLRINDTDPAWDGYEFRCVYSSDEYGQWSTYDYYKKGNVFSLDPIENGEHVVIAQGEDCGQLKVRLYPQHTEQSDNVTVNVTESVTFSSTGLALSNGNITAEWEFGVFEPSLNDYVWAPVQGSDEFGGTEKIIKQTEKVESEAAFFAALNAETEIDKDLFYRTADFYQLKTSLTVDKVDLTQDGYRFRVRYQTESSHGTQQEWYSDVADNLDGAWTTDNGEFGSFIPTPRKDFSNTLSVLPAELIVISTPAAGFDEGAKYEDKTTPDSDGQWLKLPDNGGDIADGTAAYQVTVYYKPDMLMPQTQWKYRTLQDSTAHEWNTEIAEELGYTGVVVSVHNSQPVDTTYNGEGGWKSFTSTMMISNVPASMYDTAQMLKYFFRCEATTTYTTVKQTSTLSGADRWGGLGISYAIDIMHNGVIEYGVENRVNGTTATTGQDLVEATAGQTESVWYFPRLSIQMPEGKSVNTAIISFENEFDARDEILFDQAAIERAGISVQKVNNTYLVLTSQVKNTVEKSVWETVLRENISFKTYDADIDLTLENIATGHVGGAEVKWYIDEAQMCDLTWDSATGHAYKYVDESTNYISAQTNAAIIDEETGLAGHLATISSEEENQLVQKVVGMNSAWIGASFSKDDGEVTWIDSNDTGYMNWGSDHNKEDRTYTSPGNLVIRSDGTWESYPYNDKTTVGNSNADASETFSGPTVSFSGKKNNSGWKNTTVTLSETPKSNVTVTATVQYSTNGAGDTMFAFEYWNGSKWVTMSTSTYMDPIKDGNYWDYCNYPDYIEIWYRPYTGTYTFTATLPASKTQQFRVLVGNNASTLSYYANITGMSLQMDYTYDGEEEVIVNSGNPNGYVIEYDNAALAMANTSHSAYDDANIGTDIPSAPEINEGGQEISIYISGNQKVYDKTPITPVLVASGSLDLLKVTYSTTSLTAGYSTRTVGGADYENTGAVNAATYHVSVSLTDEAIQAGYKIADNSQLETDLIISQRPLDVFSYGNNKVYDGTSGGTITNLQFKPKTENRGIISGDIVELNTSRVPGSYTTNGVGKTIHTSANNNNNSEWEMARNKESALNIIHYGDSDPFYNYYIASEDFSGHITPRPVTIHSCYLEDAENPRNIKAYDGTAQATIQNITLDNTLPGDNIGLTKNSIAGVYERAEAGELLNTNGTLQTDRLQKLTEYTITPSESIDLTNNEYGDYYIADEQYSGAIYRASVEVRVRSWSGLYGTGLATQPWHNTEPYSAQNAGSASSWLLISGLTGSDTIILDDALSGFAFNGVQDPQMDILPDTPVGDYSLTYTGLNEANYPVLSNYFVYVMDGVVSVAPREIVIEIQDSEKMFGEPNPAFHSKFYVRENEDTLREIGSDATSDYADMLLFGADTIGSTLLVGSLDGDDATALYKENGVSNIPYYADCDAASPAVYELSGNYDTHDCDFCAAYYGTGEGTDHWNLAGYEVTINQNHKELPIVKVASVINAKDEEVQNYTVSSISGALFVHPERRFQLRATVPLQVCMHAYAADGSVQTPDNYGITNYSNGAILVTNINVSNDGWVIVDKEPENLKAGEMTFILNGTHLVMGNNEPQDQKRKWVISRDDSDDGSGTFKRLPMRCYIAGGNTNDASHAYIAQVSYTLVEYGLTLPDQDGTLPDGWGGQPVNP